MHPLKLPQKGPTKTFWQIPGLRNALHDASNRMGETITHDSGETSILVGENCSVTSHEILAAVPPRTVVDRLISEYFSYSDIAPGKIQRPDDICGEAKLASGDPQYYLSEASESQTLQFHKPIII